MVIRPIPYGIAAGVIVLVAMRSLTNAADAPTGDATIRAAAGGSEIVITTTSRLAGAIHSVTWNGKEFIDSTDHGCDSASSVSTGRSGRGAAPAPEGGRESGCLALDLGFDEGVGLIVVTAADTDAVRVGHQATGFDQFDDVFRLVFKLHLHVEREISIAMGPLVGEL